MKKCAVLIIMMTLTVSVEARLTLPNQLMALDRVRASNHYLIPLFSHFVTQKNQGYCSVASAVMVLNTLQIPAPIDKLYQPYAYFTQENFFNEEIRQIITEGVVSKIGMTLQILTNVLNTYPVHAQAHFSEKKSTKQFKADLISEVSKGRTIVIVNFHRRALGQEGPGHFSPVAAYNNKTDQFLILDVARYKYEPFWVKADDLVNATKGIDFDSKQSRGFITVERLVTKA